VVSKIPFKLIGIDLAIKKKETTDLDMILFVRDAESRLIVIVGPVNA
jgi:hypothetical protein